MIRGIIHEMSRYHVYFAPRGKERLLILGEQLSQRHLSFSDKLIGIVGDAGSGKSSIIRGMFPGLELVNHDDGINPFKIMQMRDLDHDYNNSTYHLDMRFQLGFMQMYEIVNFVSGALKNDRRIIVEHFDLLYPYLKINADIMVGIGEEILVTRPSMFGPLPKDIYDIVFSSLKYRKMAHSIEDITAHVLSADYGIDYFQWSSSEVRRGFLIMFKDKLKIDIKEIEDKVREMVNQNLDISYNDEKSIKIGESIIQPCNGPRLHIRNTSEVEEFHILKEMIYDKKEKGWLLIGLVNSHNWPVDDLNNLSNIHY